MAKASDLQSKRSTSLTPLLKLAGVAGLGATVIEAVRRRRGLADSSRSSSSMKSGGSLRQLLQRDLKLVRLGLRGGRRYTTYRARQTFASAGRKEELVTQFQMETAEDVTRELGNMKGAMMKLGQMASYIDTGLPDNVRSTLAALQRDAPPMSPELAAEQIENELGAPPEKIFLEWDRVPIAAASIGQVHRALTHEGQAVAVKVQYPGVAEAVAADLRNANWLFAGLSNLFPGMEPGPVADEIKERLAEELDYEIEAANQRYFAASFAGHPTIHVPGVVDQYCTAKILTTELATGSTFEEATTWDQEQRNLAAETLFRFSFGAIYRLHAFNGDPHPGNYLFNPDGKVTFLDFGLVKRFSEAETKLFESMITEMIFNRDMAAFREVVVGAGLLSPTAPFSDDDVGDYFSYYYKYLQQDSPTSIDEAYAAAGVAHLLDTSGHFGELMKELNVPPAFVVVQRITLGLMGLFAQLRATANWQAIAKELWTFIDAEPSTAMGVAIAEWERTKG